MIYHGPKEANKIITNQPYELIFSSIWKSPNTMGVVKQVDTHSIRQSLIRINVESKSGKVMMLKQIS